MAIIDIPGPSPAARNTRSGLRTAAITLMASAAILLVIAVVPGGQHMRRDRAPGEKTSLLQWAQAGGETAVRYTDLSARTGRDMLVDPDFSIEHAGKDYIDASQVTRKQMSDLGQKFILATPSDTTAETPASTTNEEAPALDSTVHAPPTPEEKTGVLDWAQAGGETGLRYSSLSAKTGGEMFTDPNFSFENASKEYVDASEVTTKQMTDLGQQYVPDAPVEGAATDLAETPQDGALAQEKRQAFAKAYQRASTPEEKVGLLQWTEVTGIAPTPTEKTSLLQWAEAGGETAARYTDLSAQTGRDMFVNPDFTFEHAGKDYIDASDVTRKQMGELGQKFIFEPASEATSEEVPGAAAVQTPDEKTSVLEWAQAGGETGLRFSALSAKTGAEMFTDSNFSFQHAGQEYVDASNVTVMQMTDLGQKFVVGAPSEAETAETVEALQSEVLAQEKRPAFANARQRASPPEEKTSVLDWVQAGGETGLRYSALSAKTGGEMFTDPNFSFENAGKNYVDASEVTTKQMTGLGQQYLPATPAEGEATAPAQEETLAEEKRQAFANARQRASPPEEKTSVLDWVQAGGETGLRYSALSAKTGGEMFTDPNFSFENAGKNYVDASEVTTKQMTGLGQQYLPATPAEGEATAPAQEETLAEEKRQAFANAYRRASTPEEKMSLLKWAELDGMASTPSEKTSLLQWAEAGGQTAVRYTDLSARTGRDMLVDPDFTFEHAGKDYLDASDVTRKQMSELGHKFIREPPSETTSAEAPETNAVAEEALVLEKHTRLVQ